MAQQSTTEPRETKKTTQGARTREQQKAVINGEENTKGIDVDPGEQSIAEAREHVERPEQINDLSTGDRSIPRGANQEGDHHKRRAD